VFVVLRDFQDPAAGLLDLGNAWGPGFRSRWLGLRGLNEGSQCGKKRSLHQHTPSKVFTKKSM
jgi:hypothetical protein